ncbi:conjugal transfer protein (plasmid) [Agrobacterium leguminum]|uniref:conjugal transfer protein n=1 Tax=Agrobacterium leguminum TaxID=2792015 RepID=UPI0010CA08A0|nr:conjugal transfer protein [Agrobacterium leguminum]WFS69574.1 conjugal transfer protein [Agrobacterium leguminum]
MKKFILAGAFSVLAMSSAYAQVPVTDAANIAINEQIKQLSAQIQQDTSVVKDNTTKTLQAITGDRTQDANQFASLATGNGFSMGQAPDFNSILSGNSAVFGGIGGQFQNSAAKLINGLNLVKMVADGAGIDLSGANQAYSQGINALTTMTALTDAMNTATKDRQNSFQQATQEIGKATDLKGALEQNTQMVLQGNQTANEAVGSLNNQVMMLNQQYKAALATSSQNLRTFAPLPDSVIRGGDEQASGSSVRDQLQAFEEQNQ